MRHLAATLAALAVLGGLAVGLDRLALASGQASVAWVVTRNDQGVRDVLAADGIAVLDSWAGGRVLQLLAPPDTPWPGTWLVLRLPGLAFAVPACA